MTPESKIIRPRRYRRTTLSGDSVAAILSRRFDLVINNGAEIIALQPNSNLFPTGVDLILYSDEFDIVPPDEEPPHFFGAVALEVRA